MTGTQKPLPRLMTPAEVTKVLPVSERTLENWRLRGFGPPFIRLDALARHKVVYDWHAVEAWLDTFKRP